MSGQDFEATPMIHSFHQLYLAASKAFTDVIVTDVAHCNVCDYVLTGIDQWIARGDSFDPEWVVGPEVCVTKGWAPAWYRHYCEAVSHVGRAALCLRSPSRIRAKSVRPLACHLALGWSCLGRFRQAYRTTMSN